MCRSQLQAQAETLNRTRLIWGGGFPPADGQLEEVVVGQGKNTHIRHTCIYSNYAEDAEQISGSKVRMELRGV